MIPAVTLPEFYLINKATDGSADGRAPLLRCPAAASSRIGRPPSRVKSAPGQSPVSWVSVERRAGWAAAAARPLVPDAP